jgi:hypothetical protein
LDMLQTPYEARWREKAAAVMAWAGRGLAAGGARCAKAKAGARAEAGPPIKPGRAGRETPLPRSCYRPGAIKSPADAVRAVAEYKTCLTKMAIRITPVFYVSGHLLMDRIDMMADR